MKAYSCKEVEGAMCGSVQCTECQVCVSPAPIQGGCRFVGTGIQPVIFCAVERCVSGGHDIQWRKKFLSSLARSYKSFWLNGFLKQINKVMGARKIFLKSL